MRLVSGFSLALLCAPVVVDLALSGRARPFGYAAADTFYYLTIARNMARHGVPSFDGQHATNGFHPLWMLVGGALHFATDRLGVGRYTLLVFILASLALVAGGVWFLARALSERGRLTPLFALVPVGLYGLLIAPFWLPRLPELPKELEGAFPVYGTLWSYVNGMESGAVLFCFGLSAHLFCAYEDEPSLKRALATGAALGALVLARLDHVFVALPLAVALFAAGRARLRPASETLLALAAFALPVALDVAINVHFFGSAVPVSGARKTSFPDLTSAHIDAWLALWKSWSNYNLWTLQREASLLIPLLFACGYLALTFRASRLGGTLILRYRPSARPYERFLAPAAVGVVLLAGYDICFLTDGPGSWYMPVSTLFVSLAALALVDRAPVALPARAANIALVAMAGASVVFFLELERQPSYHAAYARFYWEDAPRLRREFGASRPHLLEIDDGVVNYSLDTPAMSFGLALDPEASDADKANQLFALAYERGFNCLSTLFYGSAGNLKTDKSQAAAQHYAQSLRTEDLSSYRFHLAYLTPSGSLAIVCGDKQ
ncbi:MAG TPA: hypothetical protein VMI54_01205 [Polyangiaceae bacterium]|nr:hypothetical protein [Polyangiaceae bacterium]